MEGHAVELERLLLRPLEVAAQLGVSRSLVYRLVASGELKALTVGKSLRIPTGAVHQFVAKRRAERRLSARSRNSKRLLERKTGR